MENTNEKRRNKKGLILLWALLAVVTCAFIGTLAKYTLSGDVSDDAAAAKFGLNIPTGIELFSSAYDNVGADIDGKKIIAPGTSGQSAFSVTGTSEVAYKVGADVAVVYSEEWDGYAPLLFSLDGEVWMDLAAFQQKLSTELASEVMEPNTAYESAQIIHWQWPFDVSSANDIKDTAMGVKAADGTVPEVTVNITVTATQID